MHSFLPALVTLTVFFSAPLFADTVYVYDRSGSMAETLGGTPNDVRKIDVARAAMQSTFAWVPGDRGIAFLSFPSDGACGVTSNIPVDRGPNAKSALTSTVQNIEPDGLTPLALAIDTAGAKFHNPNEDNRIIVITDGLETCEGDPAAMAAKWRNAGMNIVMHIISFAVAPHIQEQLRLISEAGGGVYIDVSGGSDLSWVLAGLSRYTAGGKCDVLRSGNHVDRGDGFVLDTTSGLTWQKCAPGQTFELCNCRGAERNTVMSQARAEQYCASLKTGGRAWRLPEMTELQTMIEPNRASPYIDRSLFWSTGTHRSWTSMNFSGRGMIYDFRLGEGEMVDGGDYRVRCVAQ